MDGAAGAANDDVQRVDKEGQHPSHIPECREGHSPEFFDKTPHTLPFIPSEDVIIEKLFKK
jgi:hypothetical protein